MKRNFVLNVYVCYRYILKHLNSWLRFITMLMCIFLLIFFWAWHSSKVKSFIMSRTWFSIQLCTLQMETIIERMQDEHSGVPVRTVKSFMSKIPSVFTGRFTFDHTAKSFTFVDFCIYTDGHCHRVYYCVLKHLFAIPWISRLLLNCFAALV